MLLCCWQFRSAPKRRRQRFLRGWILNSAILPQYVFDHTSTDDGDSNCALQSKSVGSNTYFAKSHFAFWGTRPQPRDPIFCLFYKSINNACATVKAHTLLIYGTRYTLLGQSQCSLLKYHHSFGWCCQLLVALQGTLPYKERWSNKNVISSTSTVQLMPKKSRRL